MKKIHVRVLLDFVLFLIPLTTGILVNKENTTDFRAINFSSIHRYIAIPKNAFNLSGKILWLNCLLILGLSTLALYGKTRNARVSMIYIGYVFMGMGVLIFGVNLSKRMVRKLRPDSFSGCVDKIEKLRNLENFHIIKEKNTTNILTTCNAVSDGFNQSFFSGHAAGIIYATFIFVFLVNRLFKKKLVLVANLTLTTWAAIVCLSREISGRHHIEDIIPGMLFGGVLAYYMTNEFLTYAENNRKRSVMATK